MNPSRIRVTPMTRLALVICICVLSIASVFSLIQAAPWTEYTGEVTLDGERSVVDACVIKEGATYKMWYTHSRTDMDITTMADNLTTIISSDFLSDFVNLNLEELLIEMANIADTTAKMDALWDFITDTTTVIGYAESSDGIDWDVVSDEVLSGASGTLESVGSPSVIYDGGEYKMWFTHSTTSLDKAGLQAILQDLDDLTQSVVRDALIALLGSTESAIGYASSIDGTSWSTPSFKVFSVDGGGLWESVSNPCVINEGGVYKTWYTYTETDFTETDITDILSDIGNFGVVDILNIIDDTKTTIGYTISSTSTSVDIGSGAQVYSDSIIMDDFTVIDRNNPASASGIIDTVELWAVYPMTGVKVGAFYLESGNVLSARGSPAYIGDVAAGSKQTFSGLSIPIQEGDYIGLYAVDPDPGIPDDARLECELGSGSGYYYLSGDYTDSQNITYLPTINRYLGIGGYSTTWEAGHAEVLAGSGGVWDSVAAPSVINNGSNYEMWFTYTETDLTQAEIQDIFDELQLMETDILAMWDSYDSGDLDPFLNNFTDLIDTNTNMQNIKDLLANTENKIGYTTSPDGIAWAVATEALAGSGGPWGSVSAPCVILDSGTYEMWFTQGIDDLTAQNIIDLMDGSDLPIGYATFGVELVTGWNFIGLLVSPDSPDTADVLSGIIANVQTVWAYDAATATWDYYTTLVGPPQGDLLQMDVGVGYWIELTNPASLAVSGVEPAYPYDIDLVIGWNLISIPKTPATSAIADVLSDIIANVQTVWNYDAATATWHYYTTLVGPPQGDLTDMTEGKAYWIEMTAADKLTIN